MSEEMQKQPKAPTQLEQLENIIKDAIDTASEIRGKCDNLHSRAKQANKEPSPSKGEQMSFTQKLIHLSKDLILIQRDTLATLREVL